MNAPLPQTRAPKKNPIVTLDRVSHESENPFCTRRIRPGAIPFLFPPGQSADTLLERLQHAGWQGQILGNHGTGKSSLLASLLPRLEQTARPAVLIELHDGQRRLPFSLRRAAIPRSSLIIVDGYEQLSLWNRLRLAWFCRCRGCGLLVTAHRSVGLPTLYQTAVTPDIAKSIVERLMAGPPLPCSHEELAARLAHRQGNLRETLFDLYDLYEQKRPAPKPNVT